MYDIQLEQVREIAPHARPQYLEAFRNARDALAPYGLLESALRVCHFMAQSLEETGALRLFEENLNYTAARLCAVWPKHFKTLADAEPYAHDEEKLGNYIYGTIKGTQLGNTEPGDGYRFRGRGLLQITGRDAYTRCGRLLNIDLATSPELAFDPDVSLAVAAAEWAASGHRGLSCNQMADRDDIEGITRAVNGGLTGLSERAAFLARAKAIWPADAAALFPPASRGVANGLLDIAPDYEANFSQRAAAIAIEEWQRFGEKTENLAGHVLNPGHAETEDPWYQQIGVYWRDGVGEDHDGRDTGWPWSAAFISWVMKMAEAGTRFVYNPQHCVYISRAIRDRLRANAGAGYWCYRLNEQKPAIGSIICWSRQPGIDYDHQNGGDYKAHCDLVVAVDSKVAEVIGGNVSNSVTRRPLALDESGYLQPTTRGPDTLFAMMACRI
jgi:predicted chitinase